MDDYLKKQFPSVKTSVVHLDAREGLIGARLAGARLAKGQVLLFLDSHTEANVNCFFYDKTFIFYKCFFDSNIKCF